MGSRVGPDSEPGPAGRRGDPSSRTATARRVIDIPALRALLTGLHPAPMAGARARATQRQGVVRVRASRRDPGLRNPSRAPAEAGDTAASRPAGSTSATSGSRASPTASAKTMQLGLRNGWRRGQRSDALSASSPIANFIDQPEPASLIFLWFAPRPAAPSARSSPPNVWAAYRRTHRGRRRGSRKMPWATTRRSSDSTPWWVSFSTSSKRRRSRERSLVVYLADNGWDQIAGHANLLKGPQGRPEGQGKRSTSWAFARRSSSACRVASRAGP